MNHLISYILCIVPFQIFTLIIKFTNLTFKAMAFRPAGFSDSDASDDDGDWDSGDFGNSRNRSKGGWGGRHGGGGGGYQDLAQANNNVDDVKFEDEAQQKLLERTKKYIRSCLISTKGSTEIHDLEREYQDVCEARIPFRQLGFSSVEEFLKSIPSVCRVRNGFSGMMVDGLADSTTMHIKEMKMKEKNTGGGKKKKRRGGGGGGGGHYSGGRSGFSRGFSYGGRNNDFSFDDGGFSIGGGGGSFAVSSSRNKNTSSSGTQSSRPLSTSSRNSQLYRALESQAKKKDNGSNQANNSNRQQVQAVNRIPTCETDNNLEQTTDMYAVSDRLTEILRGRAFGLLLSQVSKKYEKEWQERLPDETELKKIAGFCIEGKGTAPTSIKLIEDKPAPEKPPKVQDKEAAVMVTTRADPKTVEDGFSKEDLLVVEQVKRLLENRIWGLPKSRVEVLVRKECPANFNSDLFDQMENKNLIKIEGQHKVVKWIASA